MARSLDVKVCALFVALFIALPLFAEEPILVGDLGTIECIEVQGDVSEANPADDSQKIEYPKTNAPEPVQIPARQPNRDPAPKNEGLPDNAVEEPILVGELGAFDKVDVEGAIISPAADIASNARGTFESALASHPGRPLDRYLAALETACRADLQKKGFPDVEAAARVDRERGRVILKVKEGPQFYLGEVRVFSLNNDLNHDLVQALLGRRPQPGAMLQSTRSPVGEQIETWIDEDGDPVGFKPPLWISGKPASFDSTTLDNLRLAAKTIFERHGFHEARFDLDICQLDDQRLTEAHLIVQDLGPQAVVAKVECDGNHRDSDADLLKFLNLAVGMPCTERLAFDARKALFDSGRFAAQSVSITPPDKGTSNARLRIHVVDISIVPALSEQLSQEAQWLLKLRNWLTRFSEQPDDLVASIRQEGLGELVVALSPQGGSFAEAKTSSASPLNGLHAACFCAGNQTGIYLPSEMRRWVMPLGNTTTPHVNLQLIVNEEGGGDIKMGLGVAANSPEGARVGAPWKLPPAVFVAAGSKPGVRASAKDGIVTVTTEDSKLEFEEQTGKLILFSIDDKQGHTSGRFELKHGEIARRVRELANATSATSNGFDSERACSSTLMFALEPSPVSRLVMEQYLSQWGVKAPEERERVFLQLAALRQIAARGTFQALDDWYRHQFVDVRFIGTADSESSTLSLADAAPLLECRIPMLGRPLVVWADQLFPRGSWAWQETRWQGTRYATGNEEDTGEWDLAFSVAESTGLGFCAKLLRARDMHHQDTGWEAYLYAAAGEHLSTDDFRADYRALLDSEKMVGKGMLTVLEFLRSMEPSELQTLTGSLPDVWQKPLVDLAQQLKAESGKPVADILPQVLDQLWQARWQVQVAEYCLAQQAALQAAGEPKGDVGGANPADDSQKIEYPKTNTPEPVQIPARQPDRDPAPKSEGRPESAVEGHFDSRPFDANPTEKVESGEAK